MTPKRLRQCLEALHWSQRGLARVIRRNEGTVRQWARGKTEIPQDIACWLEERAVVMENNPPPPRPEARE